MPRVGLYFANFSSIALVCIYNLGCSKWIFYFWSSKIRNFKNEWEECEKKKLEPHWEYLRLCGFVWGVYFENKLVALVLKHVSSKFSATNEIWAPLLRWQVTVAMVIFSWNVSFYDRLHLYTANLIPIPPYVKTIFWDPVYLGYFHFYKQLKISVVRNLLVFSWKFGTGVKPFLFFFPHWVGENFLTNTLTAVLSCVTM